ncbi:hypothetical protein L6452_04435 [Arctium lappa]|uniref:Uncharacterized protein n=1 Tax=Arctium lappa TaxID=4217 RepID=A0ACB9EE77_ARCLA|nr:hypothetical protein L6452_04435 [Arctium lappa]
MLRVVSLENFLDGISSYNDEWGNFCSKIGSISCNSSCISLIKRWLLGAVMYFIWQERNFRIFQSKERAVIGLCTAIRECIKLKIMGTTFKKGVTIHHVMKMWESSNVNYDDVQRYKVVFYHLDVDLWRNRLVKNVKRMLSQIMDSSAKILKTILLQFIFPGVSFWELLSVCEDAKEKDYGGSVCCVDGDMD